MKIRSMQTLKGHGPIFMVFHWHIMENVHQNFGFSSIPIGSVNEQGCWLSRGEVQALQHWKPLRRTLVQELRPAVKSHTPIFHFDCYTGLIGKEKGTDQFFQCSSSQSHGDLVLRQEPLM